MNIQIKSSLWLILMFVSIVTQSQDKAQLHIQIGHQQAVSAMAVSQDGRYLATGSIDNDIRIWDLENKLERFILKGHEGDVETLDFSKDGKYLASGSTDGKIILWNALSGKKLVTLTGHQSNVKSVIFHPNDSLLLSAGSDKVIRVWEIPSGKLQRTFGEHTQSIYALALNSKGEKLISGGLDQKIKLWDFKTGALEKVLAETQYPVFDLEISPNDSLVLSAGGSKFEDKGELKVWSFISGNLITDLEGHQAEIYQARFSPNGLNIISAGGSDIRSELKYWNVQNEVLVRNLEGHISRVRAVVFDKTGKQIISGGGENSGNISELKIWDTDTGSFLQSLEGYVSPVKALAVNQQGDWMASGYADGTIRLWNLKNATQSYFLKRHKKSISDLVFSPSQQLLASTAEDGLSLIWDFSKQDSLAQPKIIKEWQEAFPNQSLAFSPDGITLAMAGVGDIYLVDIPTLAIKDTLTNAHDLFVYGLIFSADSKTLWSAGYDKKVKIWDLTQKKLIKVLSHPDPVLCIDKQTSEANWLSVCYDSKIRLWNNAGQPIATYTPEGFLPQKAIFTEMGSDIALAGKSSEVKIMRAGKIIQSLQGHQGEVQALAKIPQSNYLLSGAADGLITLWDLNSNEAKLYFIHFNDSQNNYLVLSPEGEYTSQGDKERTVYFSKGEQLEQLDSSLKQRNILQDFLSE